MSFFRKMFGEKSPERGPASATASPSSEWKDNVLLGNLETARDNPEQLYGMLVSALHDGFAADIIPYAEHLWRTDPISIARGGDTRHRVHGCESFE